MSGKEENWDKQLFKSSYQLIEGLITVDEYVKKHEIGKQYKWGEIKFLKKYPQLFNQVLIKLPKHHRIQALMTANDVKQKNVRTLTGCGYGFISDLMKPDILRDFNNEHLSDIAVILDVPLNTISSDTFDIEDTDSFREYHEGTSRQVTLEQLTEDLSKKQNSVPFIKGFILKDTTLPYVCHQLYVRYELRETYGVLDFYIRRTLLLDNTNIRKLMEHLKSDIKFVLLQEPATLRDVSKLRFILANAEYPFNEKNIKHLVDVSGIHQLFPIPNVQDE